MGGAGIVEAAQKVADAESDTVFMDALTLYHATWGADSYIVNTDLLQDEELGLESPDVSKALIALCKIPHLISKWRGAIQIAFKEVVDVVSTPQ